MISSSFFSLSLLLALFFVVQVAYAESNVTRTCSIATQAIIQGLKDPTNVNLNGIVESADFEKSFPILIALANAEAESEASLASTLLGLSSTLNPDSACTDGHVTRFLEGTNLLPDYGYLTECSFDFADTGFDKKCGALNGTVQHIDFSLRITEKFDMGRDIIPELGLDPLIVLALSFDPFLLKNKDALIMLSAAKVCVPDVCSDETELTGPLIEILAEYVRDLFEGETIGKIMSKIPAELELQSCGQGLDSALLATTSEIATILDQPENLKDIVQQTSCNRKIPTYAPTIGPGSSATKSHQSGIFLSIFFASILAFLKLRL